MKRTDAVSEAAKDLNDRRVTYEGGAARAEAQDVRREMMLLVPADKFLDEEHFLDCIEEVKTWAPDAMRQKMLRKLGGGQARGHVLRQDEFDAIAARVGAERT